MKIIANSMARIASGDTSLPDHKIEAYRKQWADLGFDLPVWNPCKNKSSVGTKLHEIIHRETGQDVPCDKCAEEISALNCMTAKEARREKRRVVDDIYSRAWDHADKKDKLKLIADVMISTASLGRISIGKDTLGKWFDEAVGGGSIPEKKKRKRRAKKCNSCGKNRRNTQRRNTKGNTFWKPLPSSPEVFNETVTRNLMVHIFPVVGKWEWLVDRIKSSESEFNGRRLISIMETSDGVVRPKKGSKLNLDSADKVKKALEGFDCEITVRQNNSSAGESVSLSPMVKELKTNNPNHITLYLHSKGAKHTDEEFKPIMSWNSAMLLPLLNTAAVEAAFTRGADVVGAIGGDVFDSGDTPMGSYYWYRNSAAPPLSTKAGNPFYTSEYWPSQFTSSEFLLGTIPGRKSFKALYTSQFWAKGGNGQSLIANWKLKQVPAVKSPLVTLITPTGDRPEAFKLCEKWVSQQTYKGDIQWIVVDDGLKETKTTKGQVVIKRVNTNYSSHTLPQNMTSALPEVKGDFVIIIEDDDYYPPEYLDLMVSQLQVSDLVGERGARYYYLPTGTYRHYKEHTHSSLCRTGFRKSVLPLITEISSSSNQSIDLKLWEQWKGSKQQWRSTTIGCIGMKGMPGRQSHNKLRPETPDVDKATLKRWIKDWENYIPFIPSEEKPTGVVMSVVVNGYDPPRPAVPDKSFPSVMLSNLPAEIEGWGLRVVDVGKDHRKESRRLKILACNEFPDYEWILYYDGQLQLLKSSTEWFESARKHGEGDLYVYQHQDRNCIYAEGKEVVRIRKDVARNVNGQLNRYKSEGVPENGGLYLGGIHIRKNTPKVREFERIWWDEVSKGSVRDQISMPVAIHRSGVNHVVMPSMEWAKLFQRYHHHTNDKIKEKIRSPSMLK